MRLKSLHPNAYFYNGDNDTNSHYEVDDLRGNSIDGLSMSERVVEAGVDLSLFYGDKKVFSVKQDIPTVGE